jgi:hypothetical protein
MLTPPKPFKTIKDPQISINKLGEYMEADATRRRAIIHATKYPTTFSGALYDNARRTTKDYLTIHRNAKLVEAAIERLKKKKTSTTWQETDRVNSIDMLESLLKADLSGLKGTTLSVYTDRAKSVMIKGVKISVNPDIIVSKSVKGVENKGAIKLHFSKTHSLLKGGQAVVGMMLHHYMDHYSVVAPTVANRKLCF